MYKKADEVVDDIISTTSLLTLRPESSPCGDTSDRQREAPEPQVPNHSAREHEPTGPKRHQPSRKPPSSWRSCQTDPASADRKSSPSQTTWTWFRWHRWPTPASGWQGDCHREQLWSPWWRPSNARTRSRHHLPHRPDRWHSSKWCHARQRHHDEWHWPSRSAMPHPGSCSCRSGQEQPGRVTMHKPGRVQKTSIEVSR